ncbi:MAG: type II toxin-antitoxin system RelE/ParE family toxin [Deltaproteobacteria bacterium]|nr:type II toxin-antitoxin system RelE/ParE family toxin [Deltaproteobacteria bacterium]
MTTVVVVAEAEEQLREIIEWWVENRPAAPALVLEEFARCVELLEHSPDAGPRFLRTRVPGVRRLVMKRTRHLVYYVHDEENAVVYIITVWGAPREGDPALRDPRR